VLEPIAFAARLLWPPRCAGCDRFVPERRTFCDPCAEGLLPLPAACSRCALPGADPCGACRRSPPPFSSAAALLIYGGAASQALLRLKHGGRLDVARSLGRLLLPALLRSPPADLLLAVPLHPRRLRDRGFNQALELLRSARAAASRGERRRLPPLSLDALQRRRPTPPLGRLSPEQRRSIVAGAFGADREQVAGRRLVLVDDVMTTGATFSACALALRQAGAAAIGVLALARAV
jgi:ComF family protein